MALTDENGNGMVMPVQPMNGGNGNAWGGDWSWIILFLIFAMFGGGYGNGGFGGMGVNGAFPWLVASNTNTDNLIGAGFNQAATAGTLNGISSGISNLSTQICGLGGDIQNSIAGINNNLCNGFANTNLGISNGFNGVNAAINNAQNAVTQQMYTNQIADLERSFAAQTAQTAGMTALQSQLANCCCDNRLATEGLKYTIATENCADREALNNGVRDIIANNTTQTQAILDKLCQLELDNVKQDNANLRTQLNMANLAASQSAQTAQILAGQSAEIDGVYNRLKNCPVPSMPVYGNTPIFSCNNNNNNCGCGCGSF